MAKEGGWAPKKCVGSGGERLQRGNIKDERRRVEGGGKGGQRERRGKKKRKRLCVTYKREGEEREVAEEEE